MGENEIKINKIEIINNSFGVYYGEVIPPDSCVCRKGDKDFSRFFYVLKGEIIFNKETERELRVKSGEIVYLPKDITYLSEWNNTYQEIKNLAATDSQLENIVTFLETKEDGLITG